MGPLATADFYRKIVEETSAACDQEHIPVVICSLPDIPCRTSAILRDGSSPLPRMLDAVDKLMQSEVDCILIPCNTAHYWYNEVRQASGMPVLHIVDAVHEELQARHPGARRLGLLGTESTLAARIYQQRLAEHDYAFTINKPAMREAYVVRAIELVKQGQPKQAGKLVEQAVRQLLHEGVEVPILACTELPLALEAVDSPLLPMCIDTNRALARAGVAWATRQRSRRRPPLAIALPS
jgi:aspartate racemase